MESATGRSKSGAYGRVVEFVYSPDDGGWYAEETLFTPEGGKSRVTIKIYPTEEAARAHALSARFKEKNVWEAWS